MKDIKVFDVNKVIDFVIESKIYAEVKCNPEHDHIITKLEDSYYNGNVNYNKLMYLLGDLNKMFDVNQLMLEYGYNILQENYKNYMIVELIKGNENGNAMG